MIAIDPGPEQSAWVMMRDNMILDKAISPNQELLQILKQFKHHKRVIEMVASYGMPVGREVFETCVWIGRFYDPDNNSEFLYRKDVKMHLCGNNSAKDSNIRQALIDKYGPGKDKAIGKKHAQGPLYGFKKDLWAALAVAVTWMETKGGIECGANTNGTARACSQR